MRAFVLAALVAGMVGVMASSAAASGPSSLGVTGWQIYATTAQYANPTPGIQIHGNPTEYGGAPAIPAQNSAGWADCGPSAPTRYGVNMCPSPTTIGMAVHSVLGGCWANLNFTWFQALVSIPAGTNVSQFSVNMSGADDGARISLVNSAYPNGVTPAAGYIYQGTPQSTGDLSSYVVPGEVNRVIITQVDDCAVGNNLNSAQVFLNGTVIPPAPADTTPPSDAPSYPSGWTNSDATVNWNWTDGGSGIDPANCTQSSTSSGEGAITLTATCADVAGNSATDSVTVNVDKSAPTVTYTGGGTYTVDQNVSITCSASDSVSGVASSTCAGVSGPAWSFGLGTHSVSATATDNAGNTGSGSTTFTVTVDATSLCNVVQQWAKNAGIANSLCVKLQAAAAAAARGQAKTKQNNVDAFDSEVSAQSGKAFTAAQAKLLVQFAAAL